MTGPPWPTRPGPGRPALAPAASRVAGWASAAWNRVAGPVVAPIVAAWKLNFTLARTADLAEGPDR